MTAASIAAFAGGAPSHPLAPPGACPARWADRRAGEQVAPGARRSRRCWRPRHGRPSAPGGCPAPSAADRPRGRPVRAHGVGEAVLVGVGEGDVQPLDGGELLPLKHSNRDDQPRMAHSAGWRMADSAGWRMIPSPLNQADSLINAGATHGGAETKWWANLPDLQRWD